MIWLQALLIGLVIPLAIAWVAVRLLDRTVKF